jgi:hypothetical protein
MASSMPGAGLAPAMPPDAVAALLMIFTQVV